MKKPFPASALLPRVETLAARFAARFPKYDGRNTVVAIFDTGVDPGAPGLQQTSDGKPKIIDLIDATGSGDVDTSQVYEAVQRSEQDDSSLKSRLLLKLKNGRVLQLNDSWPPSVENRYHHGTCAAFDLFPKLLVTRMRKERQEKFEIEQRDAVNNVQKRLAAWKTQHGDNCQDAQQLKIKKDLDTRLSLLDELMKKYDDPGPIYDCVVFNDGTHWRAGIDTSGTGDFTSVKAMAAFKVAQEYDKFSDESQLNYGVNVYDNGNTLSIVCDSGAHGTHCAGIVAAYHPDQPECNGVAPGAQLIAVKIGDTRLGSMETSASLNRAIQSILDTPNCDVINMSYGEYAGEHNAGRFHELAKQLVEEKGVIFVSSAGNNGPNLGSVGAPGSTDSCLLGVGAYVSPEMMQVEYSMRQSEDSRKSTLYTWSSRGPTFDGDLGVDLCAPGAAVTCVPNWTLTKKQLMNGTSMASPNCAGSIALLLSGLKDRQIEYTPFSIRQALQHTAKRVPGVDVFAQGAGLIQLLPAFEFLTSTAGIHRKDLRELPLYFAVDCKSANASSSGRGIFLKDLSHFQHKQSEIVVKVTPVFHKKAQNESKVAFEQHLRLVPSTSWLQVAEHFAVMQQPRMFKVLVDTSHLEEGVHFASIQAFDANRTHADDLVQDQYQYQDQAALFTIPVTIIKPRQVDANNCHFTIKNQQLEAARFIRRFYAPPNGATWVEVKVTRSGTTPCGDTGDVAAGATEPVVPNSCVSKEEDGGNRVYAVHLMQFEPFERQRNTSLEKNLVLQQGQIGQVAFDLRGNSTLEVCVAQYWHILGASNVTIDVVFHSMNPDSQQLTLLGGDAWRKVMVHNLLAHETLAPQVVFTKWTQVLHPKSSEIGPLSETRDMFPDKRQMYQLVNTYELVTAPGSSGSSSATSSSGNSTFKVTPSLPALTGRLYESGIDAQFCMVFDENKQYLGASDAYPTEITLSKPGTYTIRSYIRHETVAKLEKLQKLVLHVDHAIKDMTANVYAHPDDAVLGSGKPVQQISLLSDTMVPLFISEPSDKLPAGSSAGDFLKGTMFFAKADASGAKGGATAKARGSNAARAGGFPIIYSIPAASSDKKPPAGDDDKDERPEKEQLDDAIRDLYCARVKKLVGKKDFDELYSEALAKYPKHLPLVQLRLHHVDVDDPAVRSQDDTLQTIIQAAQQVIDMIDQQALALYFGQRQVAATATTTSAAREEGVTADQKRTHKQQTEAKRILIDAMARQARAFGEQNQKEQFLESIKTLGKWEDVSSCLQLVPVALLQHRLNDLHGMCLQRLLQLEKQEPASERTKVMTANKLHEEKLQTLQRLGWTHWYLYEQHWQRRRFAASFRRF